MKIDLQDVLLIAGVVSIVGGVGTWSRPAAAVVFGLFCLAFVTTIGRSRREKIQGVQPKDEA